MRPLAFTRRRVSRANWSWPANAKGLLRPESEVALFRALQEALSNASRHSGGSLVSVTLALREEVVTLAVHDDGVGLDDAAIARLASGPGRSGLVGMRERVAAAGGTVRLSAGAPGLLVDISMPVKRT